MEHIEVSDLDKQKMCELIHKVQQKEMPDSDEIHFLKMMYEQKLIDVKGIITQKGIDELYQ